jgi:hypothetical protein
VITLGFDVMLDALGRTVQRQSLALGAQDVNFPGERAHPERAKLLVLGQRLAEAPDGKCKQTAFHGG